MLSQGQQLIKRCFDLVLSSLLLLLLAIPMFLLVVLAKFDTGASGLFRQVRIGQKATPFRIYKIRSMSQRSGSIGHISKFGRFLRRSHLDETPQLLNVLIGDMSFVGPRPDLPGYADQLAPADALMLSVKPGITGPATLKYRDEQRLLAQQDDPDHFNKTVIWKDKVAINNWYVHNWSFYLDLQILFNTIFKRHHGR